MTPKDRLKIRKRLRDAFRFRSYPRPTHCNYCGRMGNIEVHHFRYKPEDYVWVCRRCHSDLHEGFNLDGEGNNYKEGTEKSISTKKKISDSLKDYYKNK